MQVRFLDLKYDPNPDIGYWVLFDEDVRRMIFVNSDGHQTRSSRKRLYGLDDIPQPEHCGNNDVLQAWLRWLEMRREDLGCK